MDAATKDGLAHLRSVKLTMFDIGKLQLLVTSGGEANWYPERAPAGLNELFDGMVTKRLVEFLDVTSRQRIELAIGDARVIARHGSRVRIRLTDEGRTVAARLDEMNAAPKREVSAV